MQFTQDFPDMKHCIKSMHTSKTVQKVCTCIHHEKTHKNDIYNAYRENGMKI